MSTPRVPYHHGDLKRSLVAGGLALVEHIGVEALTLQKLAKHCGVSAPALYHHFRNKDELLQELGMHGLALFEAALAPSLGSPELGLPLEEFALAYVTFAREHPELYELMFGRITWRKGPRGELHERARKSFRAFVDRVSDEQRRGRLPDDENPLRLAQVAWATLHGLCRMHGDGLVFSKEAISDIACHAAKLLGAGIARPHRRRAE